MTDSRRKRIAGFLMTLAALSAPRAEGQTPARAAAPVAQRAEAVTGWPVTGRVVSTDGRTAIRRAIVKITGASINGNLSTITDDQGRFAIDRVPAGRVTITASKPAFLTTAYGATAPGRAGTPVSIGPGVPSPPIEIRLARGAVITGTVRTETGEPVPYAQIVVATRQIMNGQSAPLIQTDDQGVYRAYELAAGTYYVAASVGYSLSSGQIGLPTTASIDTALQSLERQRAAVTGATATVMPPPITAFTPLLYPAATTIDDALPITVAAGEERAGIDFVLSPRPAVSIEGTVSSGTGPMPPVFLELRPVQQLPFTSSGGPSLAVAPGPTGRFKYLGITPGHYVLTIRSATPSPGGGMSQMEKYGSGDPLPAGLNPNLVTFARTELDVSGADITGLALTLQPALRVQGRVEFAAASLAPPADLTTINVNMPYVGGLGGMSVRSDGSISGRINVPVTHPSSTGSFELSPVLPALYRITAAIPGDARWWLRSVMVGGQDVLDRPLDMTADVSNAVVTFTDRRTELTGVLQTPAGAPATEFFVAAFPTDRTLWRTQARRMMFARPATDGEYALKDLPPGEYYLAALTDLDPATWQTPEFLDTVVPAALKLTIGEGEQKKQDLRLAQ